VAGPSASDRRWETAAAFLRRSVASAVVAQTGRSPARTARIEARRRNDRWKNPPMYIDMSVCINCDACLRACPPSFGAIFNHGIDVVIIPELCSGCDKCLDPCPVDCIHPLPDPGWDPAPEDWWTNPLSADDPYLQ
jgi:H+/Na+-translocating ferredoxin:NAD+ oxidoreductase subunit B